MRTVQYILFLCHSSSLSMALQERNPICQHMFLSSPAPGSTRHGIEADATAPRLAPSVGETRGYPACRDTASQQESLGEKRRVGHNPSTTRRQTRGRAFRRALGILLAHVTLSAMEFGALSKHGAAAARSKTPEGGHSQINTRRNIIQWMR